MNAMKLVDKLDRWFVPINLRRLVRNQGGLDAVLAFSMAIAFLVELARPGTFTSRDSLRHMKRPDLRRFLASYLWYAFMYMSQMTVSFLLYVDVRKVYYKVEVRRRSIRIFLVFAPVWAINLLLSAAGVLYFPWSPLGPFYVMHTMFVTAYWLYALRYYCWLGDGEVVHFESPLVLTAENSEMDDFRKWSG